MNEKDAARELYEHRNDPEEWGEEEEIEVKPRRSSVVSFRLPPEEFAALERAMENTGESLSEFIRKALAMRLRGIPVGGSTVEVTYGGPDELVLSNFDELLTGNLARYAMLRGSSTKATYVPKQSQAGLLNLRAG